MSDRYLGLYAEKEWDCCIRYRICGRGGGLWLGEIPANGVAGPDTKRAGGLVTSQREELLGYAKYTDYLNASKQQLQEQMKFIAATVRRDEGYTRQVNRKILGVNFNSIVAISYKAGYPVGYELRPGDYEIAGTATGITVTIRKPVLVASPATRNLRHQILSGSVFTDEQAEVIELYQGLDKRTLQLDVRLQQTRLSWPCARRSCWNFCVTSSHNSRA